MHPSRKLLKECDPKSKKPAFTVFINRKEDVADVLNLIRRQHTENWLCKALRLCIVYMFEHPELFTTKIIITAIRRAKYDGEEAPVGDDMIHEGELIAGEVGYIVGDIYSSATGGYCMSGAGSLQLAVLGAILHQCGCSVWDLGMRLKYKEECLGSVEVSRRKWVNLAKSRATSSINYENLAIYKTGFRFVKC
ncbi:hypothetical protein AGDE_05754 [Angomonas deanei]|nr:hypothetical protein AGDE_05754 [Angomonas deanei]|eukprot:EPY38177.1 hypothetical protein AGDE_05754 [Angomonas deanei]